MKTKTVKPQTVEDVVRRRIRESPIVDTLGAMMRAVGKGVILLVSVTAFAFALKGVMSYGEIRPETRVVQHYDDLRKWESNGKGIVCVGKEGKHLSYHDIEHRTLDRVVAPDYIKVNVKPVPGAKDMYEIKVRDPELNKEAVQKALKCDDSMRTDNSGPSKLLRAFEKIISLVRNVADKISGRV